MHPLEKVAHHFGHKVDLGKTYLYDDGDTSVVCLECSSEIRLSGFSTVLISGYWAYTYSGFRPRLQSIICPKLWPLL